jgi:hypothetical protein
MHSQGTLTKVEGSVPLTARLVFVKKKNVVSVRKAADLRRSTVLILYLSVRIPWPSF